MTDDRSRELALCGALFFDQSLISMFAREVRVEHFRDADAATIFAAIVDLSARDIEIDLHDLAAELARRGVLARVGGRQAVDGLVAERAELDQALDRLLALRLSLPPVDEEPIVVVAKELLGGSVEPSPD